MQQAVLDFWFAPESKPFWFQQNDYFDALIRERFADLHEQASQCELYEWRQSAKGRLAEIIVLDQFSRNLYRDSPLAFAQDSLAVALTQEAIQHNTLAELDENERQFLLMPLMHSESRVIHEQAARLFARYTSAYTLEFELKHKAIIERFGHYPHRNALLGRKSTTVEIKFIQEHGRGF